MSAGDLATISRVGGPTVLVLCNNSCYGWIKALQHLYHGARYFSVDFRETLNYVQVAEGFGLRGREVAHADDIGPALKEALDYGGPFFIEVRTAPEHEVIPPVASWQRAVDRTVPASG
jgi:acetolactate synthase-1/2/3 large subunit